MPQVLPGSAPTELIHSACWWHPVTVGHRRRLGNAKQVFTATSPSWCRCCCGSVPLKMSDMTTSHTQRSHKAFRDVKASESRHLNTVGILPPLALHAQIYGCWVLHCALMFNSASTTGRAHLEDLWKAFGSLADLDILFPVYGLSRPLHVPQGV
uniref:Uncharacterized protein n=1 Tax=Knipowitschia caucasica TaxID=637954 RepID=A0AAV2LTZ8_KNICA